MELRVTATKVGDIDVVALDGSADLAAAPALHTALHRATASTGGGTLAVDLDGLTVLDDVALGLLLGAAATVRAAGGALVLVCTSGRIRARLAATRLDLVIDVRTTVVGARAPTAPPATPATARSTPSGSSTTD